MVVSQSVKKLALVYIFLVSLVCLFIFINTYTNFFVSVINIIPQNVHQVAIPSADVVENPREQNQENETIVLFFWSKFFGRPSKFFEGVWKKGNERGKCPVACEVTTNRSRINEAKAFIVHSRDSNPLPPSKHIPWVLTGVENPIYTPVLRKADFMSQFHLSRSYRLDSDFPTPVFRKPSLEPPVAFENKTGGVMAAFSNCERVRTAYLGHLMKYIKVDSYGGCLHNKEGLTKRYIGQFREVKQALARSYKFIIVFFNQDCDYFVDDQIYHALNAGSVPIVMSTDKIYEFFAWKSKECYREC
jgi:hypothetical protein